MIIYYKKILINFINFLGKEEIWEMVGIFLRISLKRFSGFLEIILVYFFLRNDILYIWNIFVFIYLY